MVRLDDIRCTLACYRTPIYMSRTKNLLLAFILLPLALLGAVTFYIRSEAEAMVRQTVAAVSPFAEVRYGNVSVTLGGTVSVHGIDILPRVIDDSIRIEAIDVETPGLWFLLTGTDELRQGTLPQQARIELRGVDLNLSGPIAESIDQFLAAAASAGGAAPKSNCGDVERLDMKAHRRLGYPSFVFDISMGYRFEGKRGPLHVRSEWRTRELGAAHVDLEFSGAALRVQDMMAAEPSLRRFAVRYQDLSFTNRLKQFCAQASGMTVEQYVESETNLGDAAYQAQWGFVPGPGLREAYRDFLNQPGEISIEGKPPNEVELQALRLYKPQDVVAMLNLRVQVNGKPVSDLSLTVAEPVAGDAPTAKAKPGSAPKPTASPAPPPVVTRTPTPAAPQATAGYRAIAPRDLAKHVGATVRLHLSRGAVRDGSLLQVRDGMARVERRYSSGSMTLAIPLREIERAEVLIQ